MKKDKNKQLQKAGKKRHPLFDPRLRNIWLTQKMVATLYDVDVRTINYHLKKIFSGSELQEDSVIRNFRITDSAHLIHKAMLERLMASPNWIHKKTQLNKRGNLLFGSVLFEITYADFSSCWDHLCHLKIQTA